MNFKSEEKDFSFIGSLVVILIIIVIVAFFLFFFDPVRKFKSARDAERWSDVSLILNAIKDYQENNKGSFLQEMNDIYTDEWYMIVGGSMKTGCDDNNAFLDVDVYDDNYCIDISKLVDDGYLGSIPVSPTGKIKWDEGFNNSHEGTGYALMIDEEGVLYVQSCESENINEILIIR